MMMAVSQYTSCCCALLLLLLLHDTGIAGYNLSPQPNFSLKDPQLASALPKVESSYFGWTISLRPLGVIIGAPRAQSTLPTQSKVNETGAVYRCALRIAGDATAGTNCYPYIFDTKGNSDTVKVSAYTYDSEKRDNQWLGGAMDGGTSDTDKLLVCAPRLITLAPSDYLLHGVCYWINDTLGEQPRDVITISPLRLRNDQIKNGTTERYYYYMLAEQGLSAHVLPNNEEFLIGAPGIHTWKGSVVHYYRSELNTDPSLSKRDTERVLSRATRQLDVESSFSSEVPNPQNWQQQSDSYFGYAVGSGYFDSSEPGRLLYVATAPQADSQSGEAYVFDISDNTINKLYVFRGTQFGEYFGYSVLTEDLNGDGLTDVVISAPQHTTLSSYDEGAIYVFTNQGRFNFEMQKLVSPVSERGRFGTTLTKLGDINHDGYNDIAVSAPFLGNGSVFIYLGNAKGIREQPSQRLNSPIASSVYTPHMFGHGLSRGSDIDTNGFNDLAIGAPNAESVFVYRAYPVVKILATVSSQTRELKPENNRFQISVCYGIRTTSTRIQGQDIALHVVLDPKVNRVRIPSEQSNEVRFNATAKTDSQCRMFDCEVRFSVADIFKPIEMELHYELINSIPDSPQFCDTCAAVDPAEPKVYTEKIIFSTGCASTICVADLRVRSVDLSHTFVLGSASSITVTYDVSNNGETAYLPQINVTSSNRMPFVRIPSHCKLNEEFAVLVCDLNNNQPMARGSSARLTVSYDASGITGNTITLTAEAFSTGRERTPDDNIVKDIIALAEFTEVEVTGAPATPDINLEQNSVSALLVNNYEIKSNGPSNVDELEVTFHVPLAYKVPGSSATIPIINMNNLTMQAVYDSQLIKIEFFQNNIRILKDFYESSSSSSSSMSWSSDGSMISKEIIKHGMQVTPQEVNSLDTDTDLPGVAVASVGKMQHRQRRETAGQSQTAATKSQYAALMHPKAYDLLGEDLQGTLPVNRTIVFNCNDNELTICARAVLRVYNFKPEKPITANMRFDVDLNEVDQLLIEPWEFFVILVGLEVRKVRAISSNELALKRKIQYNIISKHQPRKNILWIIILAVIGGLLLLAALTYGMYRAGFFKRTTKEEMDKLVNQDQGGAGAAGDAEHDPTETENLNTDD